jgi:outer membrane protein assembly factor BamB
LHDNRTLTCWNIETGKKVYQERVEGATSNWASPVADAAGRIYLASAGTTVVLQSGPEYRVLATNSLNDANHSSPAIAGERIYLVGTKRLYAVGAK